MKRYLISALAILVGLAVSCTKPGTSGEGIPEVPKSISFDPAEVVFPVAGGSVSLIIYAPERPVLEDCPAWVTFKEGAYDKTKYKMTATLSANSNYSCEPEMGTIVFSAGSLSGSLKVSKPSGYPILLSTSPANNATTRPASWNLSPALRFRQSRPSG